MIEKLTKFYQQSLRGRLIFWFLVLSLAPLIWAIFITYQYSKTILLDQAIKNLSAINLVKSEIIDTYFFEKEKSLTTLASRPFLPEILEQFNEALHKFGKDSPEYLDLVLKYHSTLERPASLERYSNLFLVNKLGDVVYAEKSSPLLGTNLLSEAYRGTKLRDVVDDTLSYAQTEFSTLTYYYPTEPPSFFISAPLIHENKVAGIAIAQIDKYEVNRLVMDQRGLGSSGETLIVTQIENQILSLAPLRYEPNTENTTIRIIKPNTPLAKFAQSILSGERLAEKVIDYSGEETLMVGRYMRPQLNWGIITKIDTVELLAPIQKLKWFSIIMALATAGLVILIGTNIIENIISPIQALTFKTKLVALGDLKQRFDFHQQDEIGRLGSSFNEMANQLETMVTQLDSVVARRTDKIRRQNIQLKNTIRELKQVQSRMIYQDRLASLGTLTAGIAHEIKNPLNFITNFAELALQIDTEIVELIEKARGKLPPEEINELLELSGTLKLNLNKIHEHGKRADSIVFNMLQHSRGSPGEKTPTNLNALLDEYVALSYHGMRAQNTEFNITIDKNYDKSLPEVRVVPQEMSRVFLNILNNAYYSVDQKRKISNADYVPRIKISTTHDSNSVTIRILDNGMGFAKSIFPQIFTPFFTTKPFGEGTGLGLSLSYQIVVHGHGGSLKINSVENYFAEVVIKLPL